MKKKISKENLTIIIVIILLIIITALGIGFGGFISPQNCISDINDNYNSQRYDEVIKYKSSLGSIRDYLKNDDEYKNVEIKLKISEAIIEIKNKNFKKALDSIQDVKTSDETINNRINELLDDIHYNLAIEYLENKDYKQAKEEINNVKNNNYEKLNETKKNIYYEYAKQCFNQKKYLEVINSLENIGDYKESKEYINKSYVEEAEKCIDNGNFEEAVSIYNYLPDNFNYNGIKVSTRKKQLKDIKNVIKVIGKKEATKSYCETRNVWKYDGRWNSWYTDTPSPLEYIDLDLELNDNGTFNLYGKVYFNAYDDFSTLREYCTAKIVSRYIEINNIKEIPTTYKIDQYTKLLYSNGKFKIEYSEKDDYSVNFYNLYKSTVTY